MLDGNNSTFWSGSTSLTHAQVVFDMTTAQVFAEMRRRARNDGFNAFVSDYEALQFGDSPTGPWSTAMHVNTGFAAAWSNAEERNAADPLFV